MSTALSLQGVRGGCGVTTVVAALGHALHAQGERVLLVDASPDNLLGLHLGLPVDERMVPSMVAAVLAVERGASIVRVHDVRETVAALAVWQAMKEQRGENP